MFWLTYGAFLLCGVFMYVGGRLVQKKRTKKSAVAMRLLQIVSLLLIIDLALYDFELISSGVYIGALVVGLLVQLAALFYSKKSKD